jgi:hypothetical protein
MSTPTHNAWNQSPSLKLTHDNFPNLKGNVTPSCHHADKKQCTETSSQLFNANADDSSLLPPSVGTTQTELMDKHTKFQAALLTIKTSFADKLCKIKQNNDNDRKATEEHMKVAESEYKSAQQMMLIKFKAINDKYTKVLASFSSLSTNLCNAKLEQDHHHMGMKQSLGAMLHILVNISQSLATGNHPEPLQQEQIQSIMQYIQEPNRDGAPGISNTESSLTNLQGGGQHK